MTRLLGNPNSTRLLATQISEWVQIIVVNDKKNTYYQADSDVASADNPAAISIDHKNPIPRNIFSLSTNL